MKSEKNVLLIIWPPDQLQHITRPEVYIHTFSSAVWVFELRNFVEGSIFFNEKGFRGEIKVGKQGSR